MVPEQQPDERAAALDPDEDLFDFPDVAPSAAAQDGGPSDGPPEDLPLDDVEPIAVEAELEEPSPEPEPVSADGDHFADLENLEVDDDIFDFDEVFLAASPSTPTTFEFDAPEEEPVAADPEPESPAPVETIVAADGPAAEGQSQPKPKPHAPAKPAPRNEHPRLSRPLASAQAPGFDPSAPPVFPADLVVPAKRGRLIEILAVAFLVLNTSLILFAWRAGDDFRATLVQVTGAVTDAVAQGQLQAGSAQPIVVEVPVPAPADPVVEVAQDAPPITPLERTALELAQDRLDAGRFEDARRGLFNMLAGQDRAALPVEVVAEAELLIARSYYLQGQAVREDR